LAVGNGIRARAGISLSRMEAAPAIRRHRTRFRIVSEMPVRVAA